MGAGEGESFDRGAIDALVFDLDGTLMDTDDQVVEKLALRLERLGAAKMHGLARRMVMAAESPLNGLITLLDVVGLEGPVLGVWRRLRRGRRGTGHRHYRLMEGADVVLPALKARYRLGIVTTRGREAAEAFVSQHGLEGTFDVVVTRETTWRLKPHPGPIWEAARQLGVPVERCAMVGDTALDVRSARRAGARSIGVLCGFGRRRELERAGADVVLDCIPDLLSVFEE
ncbi:MAG: HAD family hydrolase [Chloroflexota bacterium]